MANEAVASPSSAYPTLPSEIWRNIFASACEAEEPMDNHSDAFDPLNERFHMDFPTTSESTEYALMFVSKYFNALATAFFLQRVTIGGTKQLTLLYKCLRESSILARNFARWTRRFDFNYKVIGVRNREKGWMGSLVQILQACRNLTHLILELPKSLLTNGEPILDACSESCRVLEVLHWGVRCPVPRSKFISTFRHIRIMRLETLSQFTSPYPRPMLQSQPHSVEEFPILHTIEGGRHDFSNLFENVSLPSLSTIHIRNEGFHDVHLASNTGLHAFALRHGERIQTLTMVGVLGIRNGPAAVPFLRQFTTLQDLVVDVTDLLRLISYENFTHRNLTRLGLTSHRPAIRWDIRDDFQAALPARLKALFPALKVLRWFGGFYITASDFKSQDGWDGTEGISIENEIGEPLKLSWLMMI